MLCSKCHKNEATVFYKQNINGEVQEYALCSECAGEQGLGFSGLNLFGSMFAPVKKQYQRKRCTLCGSTIEEIRNNGKTGCAECYSVFADELKPIISGIHSSRKHKGRAPGGFSEKLRINNELLKLKEELRSAIEKEEYEKAVTLRDRIREIEGGESNERL